MTRDKGRSDLKADIRAVIDEHVSDPLRREPATYAVLAAVLPHFEAAYQRGVMGERSRAGYKITRKAP